MSSSRESMEQGNAMAMVASDLVRYHLLRAMLCSVASWLLYWVSRMGGLPDTSPGVFIGYVSLVLLLAMLLDVIRGGMRLLRYSPLLLRHAAGLFWLYASFIVLLLATTWLLGVLVEPEWLGPTD